MKLLPALALACLLGRAAAQPLAPGTTSAAASTGTASAAETLVQNSKSLLDVQDRKTALADAEAAVQAGGGADAFAARAEAKLALSRSDDALIDYEEAARRDPARYGRKYQELLARLDPHAQTGKGKNAASSGVAGVSIVFILALAGAGAALVIFGLLFLRRKKSAGKSASEL